MRTSVFAHNGTIGIKSSVSAEGLLNNPTQKGQLGFVLDASFVDISPEALELLKKIPKSGDCIGDVDVFKAADGMVVFCWLGGPLAMINPSSAEGSRSYDASLLKASAKPVYVDPEFVKAVDGRTEDKGT